MEGTLRDTVTGYDEVSERSKRDETEGGRATPALLPVWLMTTVKEGKTYTFAINGQTGKLTCDVPADKAKIPAVGRQRVRRCVRRCGVDSGAAGSDGQRLAADQRGHRGHHRAGGRRRAGRASSGRRRSESRGGPVIFGKAHFRLDVNFDHFLYESTTRRKIEDDTQKK